MPLILPFIPDATLAPQCAALPAQCARYGELSELTALLAAGVPADVADEEGRTALFLAAANGHAAVVQLLLAHGAVRARIHAPLHAARRQRPRRARIRAECTPGGR